MRSALFPKAVLSLAVALTSLVVVAGCSTDENPITPQKMAEIRQKEGRKDFNPSMSSSPGGQGDVRSQQRQNFNPSMAGAPGQGGAPGR